MKRAGFPLLALVGVMALATTGCSSDGTGTRQGEPPGLDTAAFSVVDAEDAFASVSDATLDREMVMMPVLVDGQFLGYGPPRDRPGAHLGGILRELDVTLEQIRQMLGFVKDYWRTVASLLEGLREASGEIIAAANRVRMEIRMAFENGEITREEAEQRLRELNRRTHEAIRNNPANERFLRAICEAKRELFRSIRSVLDERQQVTWDRWIGSLEGPCFGS